MPLSKWTVSDDADMEPSPKEMESSGKGSFAKESSAKWTESLWKLSLLVPDKADGDGNGGNAAGAVAESAAGDVAEDAPPVGPFGAADVAEEAARPFKFAGDSEWFSFFFSDELLVHQQSKHVGTQSSRNASNAPEAIMLPLFHASC